MEAVMIQFEKNVPTLTIANPARIDAQICVPYTDVPLLNP